MSAGPRLTGPRLTGPRLTKQAVRCISSTSSASVPRTSASLLTPSPKSSAPLSGKYADLLREKGIEWDHPRHLYTQTAKTRPYPQPKRTRMMQTFSSSAARPAQADAGHMDNTVLPGSSFDTFSEDLASGMRMPLLPDNVLNHYAPEQVEPLRMPEICVIAANPATVSPSAITEVESMDEVSFGFMHETPEAEREPGMLTGLWKGLQQDLFGSSSSSGKPAL